MSSASKKHAPFDTHFYMLRKDFTKSRNSEKNICVFFFSSFSLLCPRLLLLSICTMHDIGKNKRVLSLYMPSHQYEHKSMYIQNYCFVLEWMCGQNSAIVVFARHMHTCQATSFTTIIRQNMAFIAHNVVIFTMFLLRFFLLFLWLSHHPSYSSHCGVENKPFIQPE